MGGPPADVAGGGHRARRAGARSLSRRRARLTISCAAGAAVLLAAAPAATPAPTRLQTTFTQILAKSPTTSATIKRALASGAVIVGRVPDVSSDLTGDGRPDAIVTVGDGGATGAVAVYVLTTHGSPSGSLRVVFASQSLDDAVAVATKDHALRIRSARWAAGDGLCCPSKVLVRTYRWQTRTWTFKRTESRLVAGPAPPDV